MKTSKHKAKYTQFNLPDGLTKLEQKEELKRYIAHLLGRDTVTDAQVTRWLQNHEDLNSKGLIS